MAAESLDLLDAPRSPARGRAASTARCLHCGTALSSGENGAFCCAGCAAVYDLLQRRGLERYYDLRGEAAAPAAAPTHRDRKWLEPLEATLRDAQGTVRLALDVQGIQCAACVWLLEALFRQRAGALCALVNPARGTAELLVTREFPLREYVADVEAFGYALGPPLKPTATRSSGLLGRIGVCAALAMNSMIFALPLYLGLRAGAVYALFRWLTFGLSVASVLVGGQVFFRSAWLGLRRGVLHLDVPIALGIALAFAGSTLAFARHREGAAYFDTLDVFIALMLAGRWLQERVLERNRLQLLASDGAEGLLARRVRAEGAVELVACGALQRDDRLLVAPGDLVPVEAMLEDARARCSLDWITGESAPREFARGDAVPAGAFNASDTAVVLRATSDFAASPLVALLRTPPLREAEAARATPWWQRLARNYTAAVLVAAVGAFALWMARTGDVGRALEVTTAVLIVTCPCAFGIAMPMAYELSQAGLRRAGLYVRTAGFLDRAQAVRRVVFDKTGTLTTGALALRDPEQLAALSPDVRAVLYNLAARSSHPKSVAVCRALGAEPPAFRADLAAREVAGQGLELSREGRLYRLGRPAWAAAGAPAGDADLAFAVDGAPLALLHTAEVPRPDARDEIARLSRDGFEVWVLSGDAPAKVSALAKSLGVPASRAVGGQSPEGKAAWLAAHDAGDTLMVGDGLNDAPAVARAHCSGTPAVDRPFMPARTDFYFVTAGLGSIGLALRAARALGRVTRTNLAAALAYNAVAVGLAYAGRMSPLLCAVLMPASSLSILLATIAQLSGRSPLWRSSSCKPS